MTKSYPPKPSERRRRRWAKATVDVDAAKNAVRALWQKGWMLCACEGEYDCPPCQLTAALGLPPFLARASRVRRQSK